MTTNTRVQMWFLFTCVVTCVAFLGITVSMLFALLQFNWHWQAVLGLGFLEMWPCVWLMFKMLDKVDELQQEASTEVD